MTLSMFQASTPVFVRGLNALSAVLGKAQAEVDAGRLNEAELMEARLAPDMFALPRQVQIASDSAKGTVARLAGRDAPAWADEERTLAELRSRIARTVDYIRGGPASEIDGSEDRPIHLSLQGGKFVLDFTGQDFLLHFAMANFYFHTTTAYGILRQKGLPLAKSDFIGAAP